MVWSSFLGTCVTERNKKSTVAKISQLRLPLCFSLIVRQVVLQKSCSQVLRRSVGVEPTLKFKLEFDLKFNFEFDLKFELVTINSALRKLKPIKIDRSVLTDSAWIFRLKLTVSEINKYILDVEFKCQIVYFATGEEKSNLANMKIVARSEGECYKQICRNRRFSLIVNDTFHNKGEKHVFFSPSNGRKVRFSVPRCEKKINS